MTPAVRKSIAPTLPLPTGAPSGPMSWTAQLVEPVTPYRNSTTPSTVQATQDQTNSDLPRSSAGCCQRRCQPSAGPGPTNHLLLAVNRQARPRCARRDRLAGPDPRDIATPRLLRRDQIAVENPWEDSIPELGEAHLSDSPAQSNAQTTAASRGRPPTFYSGTTFIRTPSSS